MKSPKIATTNLQIKFKWQKHIQILNKKYKKIQVMKTII